MDCKLKVVLKTSKGKSYPVGTKFFVFPGKSPMRAIATDESDYKVGITMLKLHKYFGDPFVKVTMKDLERASMDSVVDSMTGESVEPDGHDAYGFPSILLAAGLI